MSQAQEIAERIQRRLGGLKAGTLKIFGDWFGRPHDNVHTIVSVKSDGECLIVGFNEGEELKVWNPSQTTIDDDTFEIGKAERVRWEWFFYGRSKIAENRYFLEYKGSGNTIRGETNVDWYKPSFATSPVSPAVELV